MVESKDTKVEVVKTPKQLFVEAIQEANTIILNTPEILEMNQDKNAFFWVTQNSSVNKARRELRNLLQQLWQNGAFNYEQLARSLRVDTQTVQALMDEEFISKHGL